VGGEWISLLPAASLSDRRPPWQGFIYSDLRTGGVPDKKVELFLLPSKATPPEFATASTSPTSQAQQAKPNKPSPTSQAQQAKPNKPSPTSQAQQAKPDKPSPTSQARQAKPDKPGPTSQARQARPNKPGPTSQAQRIKPNGSSPTNQAQRAELRKPRARPWESTPQSPGSPEGAAPHDHERLSAGRCLAKVGPSTPKRPRARPLIPRALPWAVSCQAVGLHPPLRPHHPAGTPFCPAPLRTRSFPRKPPRLPPSPHRSKATPHLDLPESRRPALQSHAATHPVARGNPSSRTRPPIQSLLVKTGPTGRGGHGPNQRGPRLRVTSPALTDALYRVGE
jgi:hypothetical protein